MFYPSYALCNGHRCVGWAHSEQLPHEYCAIYTHAENAAFLTDFAGSLGRLGGQQQAIERLHMLAASEAEKDPAYVAYVNGKYEAAYNNPGKLYSESEMDEQIRSWRQKYAK